MNDVHRREKNNRAVAFLSSLLGDNSVRMRAQPAAGPKTPPAAREQPPVTQELAEQPCGNLSAETAQLTHRPETISAVNDLVAAVRKELIAQLRDSELDEKTVQDVEKVLSVHSSQT